MNMNDPSLVSTFMKHGFVPHYDLELSIESYIRKIGQSILRISDNYRRVNIELIMMVGGFNHLPLAIVLEEQHLDLLIPMLTTVLCPLQERLFIPGRHFIGAKLELVGSQAANPSDGTIDIGKELQVSVRELKHRWPGDDTQYCVALPWWVGVRGWKDWAYLQNGKGSVKHH